MTAIIMWAGSGFCRVVFVIYDPDVITVGKYMVEEPDAILYAFTDFPTLLTTRCQTSKQTITRCCSYNNLSWLGEDHGAGNSRYGMNGNCMNALRSLTSLVFDLELNFVAFQLSFKPYY